MDLSISISNPSFLFSSAHRKHVGDRLSLKMTHSLSESAMIYFCTEMTSLGSIPYVEVNCLTEFLSEEPNFPSILVNTASYSQLIAREKEWLLTV